MSQGLARRRRKIDPETKTAAVLEGLRGESAIAEICRKYQISESLCYRWRDKFWEAGTPPVMSRCWPASRRSNRAIRFGAIVGCEPG
jgi:transposase-like protein